MPYPDISFDLRYKLTNDLDFVIAGASISIPLSPSRFFDKSKYTIY